VHVVVEVDGPEDYQPLECPGDLRVDWLHRDGYPGELENLLVERVRELEFPAGRVHAFVHGETGSVKLLRRHLLGERGLTPAQLSISGYWRRGYDDESHRALKAAERDQEK
jgi:NADPH-dependent ferric siderophore reductase